MSKDDIVAFDWKGKAGAEFAEWNPTNPEGVNKKYRDWYNLDATEILAKVVEELKGKGVDPAKAKGKLL